MIIVKVPTMNKPNNGENMKDKPQVIISKPRCAKCQTGQVYFRIKQNDYVCRLCGPTTVVKTVIK